MLVLAPHLCEGISTLMKSLVTVGLFSAKVKPRGGAMVLHLGRDQGFYK